MMKKFFATILAVVMVLSLAACGDSGPDVAALTESYNSLADAYNNMVTRATENGWNQDTEIADGLNEIVDEINTIKPIIEEPSDATQEQIDELKKSCDDLYAWVGDMSAIVSEPYVAASDTEDAAEGGTDASAEGGTGAAGTGVSLLDTLEFYSIPENIPGSSWDFSGGYLNGQEMNEEDAVSALEQYGGSLQILFKDDKNVSMLQGGGTLEGTYVQVDEGTFSIEFANSESELVYSALFTDVGGTPVMMLFPDNTGLNAIYFTQSSEE